MIWDRERYIAHTLFEDTGREMFCELFGPLHALESEWRDQGASEAEIAMKAFDWDFVPVTWLHGNTGAITGIKPYTISETPEVVLGYDHYGRHNKLVKASATIPLPLDHPVKDFDDWMKVKHWYAYSDNRINREKLEIQKNLRKGQWLTALTIPGAFDEARQLLGEAETCIACYEEPEMLHDMLNTFAENAIRVIEEVGSRVTIDCLFVHEDMAGKSGPLFGPSQIQEFFKPYYQKVWDAARAYGARLFSMDSDGDMSPILGDLIECGINCIHPIEPVGGNDMVELRKKYKNKIAFKGGINKFALLEGKEAVRKELEYRLAPHLMKGGTVFALDHRIPNGVHIDTYRYYVNLGREMLGLEPISGEGWARMAF